MAAELAGLCLAALAELGKPALAAEVRDCLASRGAPLSLRQVGSGLHRLSILRPPLAECGQRLPTGSGRACLWQLTPAGRARLGVPGGRVACGTGWPGL